MTEVKKPRHRLRNMKYDEISFVDKGANQHAHVVIVKRDGNEVEKKSYLSASQKKMLKDWDKATAGRPTSGDKKKKKKDKKSGGGGGGGSSERAQNWDEEKHARKPEGSPAGGEFDKTSQESKEKYGRGGTTKAKLEAKKKGKESERGTAKHKTVQGDTLWGLAEKHYGDGSQWKKIASANGIKNPRKMPTGLDLKIPGSKLAKKPSGKRSDRKTSRSTGSRTVMEPGGRVHREKIKAKSSPGHRNQKSPRTPSEARKYRKQRGRQSQVRKYILEGR